MRWRLMPVMGLVLASGCVGEGFVLDWGLHEQRVLVEKDAAGRHLGAWQFHVAVPIGVDRSRLALAAERSLVVGDRVSVNPKDEQEFATVTGLAEVAVGASGRVGAIYGGTAAPVAIGAGTVVEGFVRASSSIMAPAAHITLGSLTALADFGEFYFWHVEPGARRALPTERAGAVERLSPGAYPDVRFGGGAGLVLGPGTYFFESLEVEGGALHIDDTAGSVYVWINRALRLTEAPRCADASRFMLGYRGEAELAIPAGFCGTLVAPLATVRISALSQPHEGAFFARSIEVADGVTIQHRPFSVSY